MISQKAETFEEGEIANDASDSVQSIEMPKIDDREECLQDFVSQLRADASQDPIFYLVRSNTSHDGE